MKKNNGVSSWWWFCALLALVIQTNGGDSSEHQWTVDGKVLELDDSNFESAISSFDYVLVDFYAPWCGHCKRLSPQLDFAAPALAALKQPIVVAKLDADKYTRFAKKYEIDGFPTLKFFIHGVPLDYNGPRKADLLVRYLMKFVAPDVSVLDSDSAISSFVEAAGTSFPIYVGFGLNESLISNLAMKYKKKAWFSVAKDFSDDVMVSYDFDKTPTLLVLHPRYKEQHIFYGPFEEEFLESFVKNNLFPLAVPITLDTLKLLGDDERKIVLTVVEDEEAENSKSLIKILKAAASANPDLVFGYVGVKQWEQFAGTFVDGDKSKLPKIVVWDRNEEYLVVNGTESLNGTDQATLVSRFIEGYREGRTIKAKISGPSFFGYLTSLIGFRSVYIIIFIVAIIMLINTIKGEDDNDEEPPPRVNTSDQSSSLLSGADTAGEHSSGLKED